MRGVGDHDLRAVRRGLDQDVGQMAARRSIEPVGEPGMRLVRRILQQGEHGGRDEVDQGRPEAPGFVQGFLDEACCAKVGVGPGDAVQRLQRVRAFSPRRTGRAPERAPPPALPFRPPCRPATTAPPRMQPCGNGPVALRVGGRPSALRPSRAGSRPGSFTNSPPAMVHASRRTCFAAGSAALSRARVGQSSTADPSEGVVDPLLGGPVDLRRAPPGGLDRVADDHADRAGVLVEAVSRPAVPGVCARPE